MSLLSILRKNLQKPVTAGVLLALAVGAWGVLWLTRSSPANSHIEAGIAYARQRQGHKAEQEWREASRLDADDPRPWEYLSEYYVNVHNWPAATEALHRLMLLKPQAPHLNARLAQCSLQAGDERAAYGYAEESLKREPEDVETIRLFGTLLARTGEDQRRLDLLRRLVKLQPDSAENRMLLAEALVAKRLFAEARPLVEEILQRDPNNVEAHSLRGMITYSEDPSPQGLARAESDFLNAAQVPRFAPFAHFYLGSIYKRLGQPAKAVPHLEAAARAFPNKREVFFALSDAYGQTGRTQAAEKTRRRFEALRREESRIDSLVSQCAATPDDFEKQLELARLLLQHGEYRQAEAHLNQARALRPDDARVQSAFAQLAARAGGSEVPASAPGAAAFASETPARAGGQ